MNTDELWDRALGCAFSEWAASQPLPQSLANRYTILRELTQGGVGIVLLARDAQFEREIVIKMLRPEHDRNPHLVARFRREAHIAGRLEHPGIVPVYELGSDAQGRPFLAMKRIEGETLARLFEQRPSVSDRRTHYLRIFEQICQTMAFAHDRGVLHRDLKPANVMVGAFGDVQILDWGLAKDKTESEEAAPASPPGNPALSHEGDTLGTPLYMAPEQARGDLDSIDERTDVYGLGAILCELLTGAPPVSGKDVREVLLRASKGEYEDAIVRLDRCDADPDIVRLAKDCLNPSKDYRPADAREVARRISSSLAAAEERLEAARTAAAEERVRADGERRARRLTTALTLSLLLLGIGIGFFFWQRESRVRSLLTRAEEHARRNEWKEAEELTRSVPGRHAYYEKEWREHELVLRIQRLGRTPGLTPPELDAAFAAAFQELGIEVSALDEPAVAENIRSRLPYRSGILISALDHWASRLPPNDDVLQTRWRKITQSAALADRDPWRSELRRALIAGDRAALVAMSEHLPRESRPPQSILLLGQSLARTGADRSIELATLCEGYRQHPGDFWINLTIAHRALDSDGIENLDLAERHARIALSLHPGDSEVLALLGLTLRRRGRPEDRDESIRFLDQARTGTRDPVTSELLQIARLAEAGERTEATQRLRSFLRTNPALPPHLRRMLGDLE